jgi:hypothetical protein
MTASEASEFRKDEAFQEYILIRQWDDLGKEPDLPVDPEDILRMKKKMTQYLRNNGI